MVVTKVHQFFNTADDAVMEKKLLGLLKRHKWNVLAVAEELGVVKQTIYTIIGRSESLLEARNAFYLTQRKTAGRIRH